MMNLLGICYSRKLLASACMLAIELCLYNVEYMNIPFNARPINSSYTLRFIVFKVFFQVIKETQVKCIVRRT